MDDYHKINRYIFIFTMCSEIPSDKLLMCLKFRMTVSQCSSKILIYWLTNEHHNLPVICIAANDDHRVIAAPAVLSMLIRIIFFSVWVVAMKASWNERLCQCLCRTILLYSRIISGQQEESEPRQNMVHVFFFQEAVLTDCWKPSASEWLNTRKKSHYTKTHLYTWAEHSCH